VGQAGEKRHSNEANRDADIPKDWVANVTQIVTLDLDYLVERTGRIPPRVMAQVDAGMKLVLDLS
jgi:mRNA-degrading endonuclease toxin of MazEF toxin-antitoxin module